MKRVLLVEDSELIRSIVCDALQTCFPCVTTVVEDGAQAWEELGRHSYDLVITDIMMTSVTKEKVRKSANAAGASAYLTKPVDYNELIQLVNELILPESGTQQGQPLETQTVQDSVTESEE